MQERLQKIIARAGIASRRHAEELISSGQVRVNGVVVSELGAKADPETDRVEVDGKLAERAEPSYYMLHKPVHVVSTMSDPEGRATLRHLLRGLGGGIFPVGRLDYATAGLLVLTSDGELANRIFKVSGNMPKVFWIKVKGRPSDDLLAKIRHSAHAHLRLLDSPGAAKKDADNPWYEVEMGEARRDLLRRALFSADHPVEKMKRVKLGPLDLGDLPEGHYRKLDPAEVTRLRQAVERAENAPRPVRTGGKLTGPGNRRFKRMREAPKFQPKAPHVSTPPIPPYADAPISKSSASVPWKQEAPRPSASFSARPPRQPGTGFTGKPPDKRSGGFAGRPPSNRGGSFAGRPPRKPSAFTGKPPDQRRGGFAGKRPDKRRFTSRPPDQRRGDFAGKPPAKRGGSFAGRSPRQPSAGFIGKPPDKRRGSFTGRPPAKRGGSFARRPPRQPGAGFAGKPPDKRGGSFTGRPPNNRSGGFSGKPRNPHGAGFAGRPPRKPGTGFTGRPPRGPNAGSTWRGPRKPGGSSGRPPHKPNVPSTSRPKDTNDQ